MTHHDQHDQHDQHDDDLGAERPGEGEAGVRPGGDATVAESGDLDLDAVTEAKQKLEQAGGGH